MTTKQIREERVYSDYTFHIAVGHHKMSGLEFKQVRKQELMQRSWRDVITGLLPLACSASCLLKPRTTSPGMAPPSMELHTFEH
jgi:hypothetical protein